MYLRKSTDSEDRQVNSIEDQKKELSRVVKRLNLKVIGTYQESRSAKAPGRPEFNKMMDAIRKGKANGLLCWELNRLARNFKDGGEIMWLLEQKTIQSIQTSSREYIPEDNVIVMSVEFGMASEFIANLRRGVKRGMASKAESGWRPGRAPIGYKNDQTAKQGKKKIYVDENKFPLVRKMWDLMLTGEYSVPKIIDIANNEWGLRTTARAGEIKLQERHGYKIFTNPFYYGEYEWVGKVYQGKHQPMITPEEFKYVQKFLGIKNKSYTRHKNLPYRRMIRCGECGCSITTELKTKMIKSENKLKSFLYHHCTKKKLDTPCGQKPITYDEINQQVMELLDRIALPECFLSFALEILNRDNELEVQDRNVMIESQQKNLESCQKKIDNLLKIYISPNNADKDLISDDEFKEQKSSLLKEKSEIEANLTNLSTRANEWLELTEKTFKFAVYAKHNFAVGDYETKTNIMRSLGTSFILKDGKIDITLRKQYQFIEKAKNEITANNPGLELNEFVLSKTKTDQYKSVFETMSG